MNAIIMKKKLVVTATTVVANGENSSFRYRISSKLDLTVLDRKRI